MTSKIVDEPTRHAVVSDQPVKDFNFRDACMNGRKAIASLLAANPSLTTYASHFINGSPETPRAGTFKFFPGRLIAADRVAAFREAIAASKGDGARTLSVKELKGGRWYVWTHTGPFEGLAKAWPLAMKGASKAGGMDGDRSMPYEMYLNDCDDQTAPADYITEIWIPLKDRTYFGYFMSFLF